MKFMKNMRPRYPNLKSKLVYFSFVTYFREEEEFKKEEQQIRDEDLKIQEKLIRFWRVLADN